MQKLSKRTNTYTPTDAPQVCSNCDPVPCRSVCLYLKKGEIAISPTNEFVGFLAIIL